MSKRGAFINERQAARVPCDNVPINWERVGKKQRRSGWMNDISDGGIGYFTEYELAPTPDDIVMITPRRSSERITGRVVRVRPIGAGLCIVGCERIEPMDSFKDATIRPDFGSDRAKLQVALSKLRSSRRTRLGLAA